MLLQNRCKIVSATFNETVCETFDDNIQTALVACLRALITYDHARGSAFDFFYSVAKNAVVDSKRRKRPAIEYPERMIQSKKRPTETALQNLQESATAKNHPEFADQLCHYIAGGGRTRQGFIHHLKERGYSRQGIKRFFSELQNEEGISEGL